MKKTIIISVFILTVLSSCTFVSGLLLSDESKSMIGFWSGDTWTSDSEDTCYYDFRADGTVYITEWTEDLQSANNNIVPNYFYYSFDGEYLRMWQFSGIVNLKFAMDLDYSATETAYYITVDSVSGSMDYTQLYENNSLYMERVVAYDSRSLDARTFLEGF
ncbi:MAG TPA: hypothetical protein DCO79_11110 [Spirochaeta sp.]|nr:hypothetical protein [Spirochaeta sp.]